MTSTIFGVSLINIKPIAEFNLYIKNFSLLSLTKNLLDHYIVTY